MKSFNHRGHGGAQGKPVIKCFLGEFAFSVVQLFIFFGFNIEVVRMIKAAIVFAMFTLPTGVFAQSAPPAAEAEVLAVVNALFDGMRKVDSAMVRPLFHAKARLITFDSRNPDARIEESVDGFIQSIGRPRTEVFDEKLSNVRILIDGSLASVWADYKFFRGTTLNHCGVDHFLLVKEAGAWKIIELADTRRRENCG